MVLEITKGEMCNADLQGQENGTWYAMVRYKDWTGANKQKCQRGFETKREAQEWEYQFKLQNDVMVLIECV